MINVDEEIKKALLNKDNVRVSVFRSLKSEILKFKTQKNAPEYTDAEEIKILNKMSKAHEESIDAYKRALRLDLIASEVAEEEIILGLLPKAVDKDSIELALKAYMEEKYDVPEIPKKDMGLVIKYLKNLFPVNDGKEISNIVKNYIK